MQYKWDEKWTARAKLALQLVPQGSSIIDLGGGLGTISELRDCQYTSIDLERWNDDTVVADLNHEYPSIPKVDYILCLGLFEYISNPDFLKNIKKYGDNLIISYRLKSTGGMDRANNMSFNEFELLLAKHWNIKKTVVKTKIERLYLCE